MIRAGWAISTPSLRWTLRRSWFRLIVWASVTCQPRAPSLPIYPIGWRTACSFQAMRSQPTWRLPSELFGADVDYGQIVKFYEAEPVGRGRYSPPHVVGAERTVIMGNPHQAHISTSM